MTIYQSVFSAFLLGLALSARAVDAPDDPQQYAVKWRQTAAARAQIVKPKSALIARYDSDGQPVKQADPKGYYRQLLGYTANGGAVVQDFYQENQSKQTDAFVLQTGADIRDFGNRSIEHGSRMRWYNPQGQLIQTATILNGEQRGIARYHPQKGYMAVWMDSLDSDKSFATVKAFGETGKPLFELASDSTGKMTVTHFHANGQKLKQQVSSTHADNDKVVSKYWDENGKPVAADDKKIADALTRSIWLMLAVLAEYLPEYGGLSEL